MCITFLFTNPAISSIKYRLVLINNRDEYYARKTKNATLNSSGDDLHTIYGVDLAGLVEGTWLGISSKKGTIRVGNLANVTGNEKRGKQGRGPIVTSFLKSEDSFETYNDDLSRKSDEFSDFNFLSVELNSKDIKFCNSEMPSIPQELVLGYTGLGNSPLSAPFKKVEEGKKQFRRVLESHANKRKEELIKALMAVLKDETKYFPDAELLARRQETAQTFSSIHVQIPAECYGTRTRTIILVDNDNNIDYVEETMSSEDPNGEWIQTHLKIEKKM